MNAISIAAIAIVGATLATATHAVTDVSDIVGSHDKLAFVDRPAADAKALSERDVYVYAKHVRLLEPSGTTTLRR